MMSGKNKEVKIIVILTSLFYKFLSYFLLSSSSSSTSCLS
jgi:hypothetical protein